MRWGGGAAPPGEALPGGPFLPSALSAERCTGETGEPAVVLPGVEWSAAARGWRGGGGHSRRVGDSCARRAAAGD